MCLFQSYTLGHANQNKIAIKGCSMEKHVFLSVNIYMNMKRFCHKTSTLSIKYAWE